MPLFPEPLPQIVPDPARAEPVVWLRRIVVIRSLDADTTPVREVSFRCGLNIVRTADPPPGETRVIGHSVGKTLLTRLIRYCLGETHFAVEGVRGRIAARLPEAYVLAEFRVAGRSWQVVRPLRDARPGDSWAVASGDWRASLDRPDGTISFHDFVGAVERATIGGLPDIVFPNVGRAMRWLDLLGWLARDYECHYRIYNEWREPDAESGPRALNRDDSSFLMRLVMGLVNDEERPFIEEHRKLLTTREATKAEIGRLSRDIDATFPVLRDRLGLAEEECAFDQRLVGGIFTTRARQVVTEKIGSLRRLSTELRGSSKNAELYEAAEKAVQAVAVAENDLKRTIALLAESETELQQREQSSAGEYYTRFSPARNCPADNCPLKPTAQSSGRPDPERAARIAELKQLRNRYREQIFELNARIPKLKRSHGEAKARYEQEQARRNKNMRGISRQIGHWKLLAEQANVYETDLTALAKAEKRLAKLDREYDDSLGDLEAARARHKTRARRVSHFFDWTLKQLIGTAAEGSIRLDARGLHPSPGESVAANGAALGTLASVLGFDLACLAASASGIGHFPRFLIHDSPREGDIERALYHRLFRFVADLERTFGGREPSFQYIVTTTTQPPSDLAGEPHVRLTLDAREEQGLLLRERF